jgi:hypothetical protein
MEGWNQAAVPFPFQERTDQSGRHQVQSVVFQAMKIVSDEFIRFTEKQSEPIGGLRARPGHGLASSRAGTGIGLSTDNFIMVLPAIFEEFRVADCARIGAAFGGTAIRSCGYWGRWIEAIKNFQSHDDRRRFQFADRSSLEEMRRIARHVRRLWKPGVKLIVGSHVQDPQEQPRLCHAIREFCS